LLGISALTVKNHLQRIYRTLGVGNRAHALARCIELRLLDQDCGRSARCSAS
jgi:DNA-binding CsgD family transcriptional regulator